MRAEGVGVEGGSAEYVSGGGSSETFSLTGLAPGTYDVFFEGFQANQVNQPVPRVTVSAGGSVAGIALSVRSGAHVYGTVTAGGQPVPYGSVYADRQEADGSWTRVAEDETGPSGDFHLVRLRPGTHRIIMSPLGSDAAGYGSFTTTVVLPSLDSFVEVNGALPAESRITGVVTGAGGRLVAGATVRALGSDGYGTDTTDAAGRYTITGLNAGTYRVEVDPPDSHDELETSVTGVGVGAGAQASRNIALQVGGSISGVITRSDGSFAAAEVSAYRLVDGDWHYVASAGSTKATGRYTLHALPPGQYRINTVRYTTSTFFVHVFYPDAHTIDEAESITVGSGQALTGFDVMSGDGGPSILNTTAPSFKGTVRVGQTLTADPGTWSHPGATFRYSWDTDDDQVGRSQTFKVTPDLLGEKLSLGVHASASYYTSGYASTAPVTVQPGIITNTSRPKISGTPRLGNTLKATVGKWSPGGVTASFRWYAGTQAIKKTKAQTLVLRKAQLGKRIKVRVTVVKDGYARTRVFSLRTKKVTR